MQISLVLDEHIESDEAIEFLKTNLDARLRAARCPVHQRPPGSSDGKLAGRRYAWTFGGLCCETLVEEIKTIFADVDESVRRRFASS